MTDDFIEVPDANPTDISSAQPDFKRYQCREEVTAARMDRPFRVHRRSGEDKEIVEGAAGDYVVSRNGRLEVSPAGEFEEGYSPVMRKHDPPRRGETRKTPPFDADDLGDAIRRAEDITGEAVRDLLMKADAYAFVRRFAREDLGVETHVSSLKRGFMATFLRHHCPVLWVHGDAPHGEVLFFGEETSVSDSEQLLAADPVAKWDVRTGEVTPVQAGDTSRFLKAVRSASELGADWLQVTASDYAKLACDHNADLDLLREGDIRLGQLARVEDVKICVSVMPPDRTGWFFHVPEDVELDWMPSARGTHVASVDLDDMTLETDDIPSVSVCPSCEGSRRTESGYCETCGGQGAVSVSTCEACGGEGSVDMVFYEEDPCETCKGDGKLPQTRTS